LVTLDFKVFTISLIRDVISHESKDRVTTLFVTLENGMLIVLNVTG
jgi:hypothetical protein